MRRLPRYIAGGPVVSDLAYDFVARAVAAQRFLDGGGELDPPTTDVELVEALADEYGVDEADVLRAFAELERAGVLEAK